eukprot:3361487-Karenia_brevis.AAC.1
MRGKGWAVCSVCNKSAAANRRGGIHESCAAAARAIAGGQVDEWAHLADGWEEGGWAARLRDLPSMHEIFTALVSSREFTHK